MSVGMQACDEIYLCRLPQYSGICKVTLTRHMGQDSDVFTKQLVHDQTPTLSAHVNSEVQHIKRSSFEPKPKPRLLLAVCVSFEQPAGWHMLQLTPSGVRALSSSCRSLSLLRSRSSLLSCSGEGPTCHQSVPSVMYHYPTSGSGGMLQC